MMARTPAIPDEDHRLPKKPATAWIDFLSGFFFGIITAVVIWHRCKRNDVSWGWVVLGMGAAVAVGVAAGLAEG